MVVLFAMVEEPAPSARNTVVGNATPTEAHLGVLVWNEHRDRRLLR